MTDAYRKVAFSPANLSSRPIVNMRQKSAPWKKSPAGKDKNWPSRSIWDQNLLSAKYILTYLSPEKITPMKATPGLFRTTPFFNTLFLLLSCWVAGYNGARVCGLFGQRSRYMGAQTLIAGPVASKVRCPSIGLSPLWMQGTNIHSCTTCNVFAVCLTPAWQCFNPVQFTDCEVCVGVEYTSSGVYTSYNGIYTFVTYALPDKLLLRLIFLYNNFDLTCFPSYV